MTRSRPRRLAAAIAAAIAAASGCASSTSTYMRAAAYRGELMWGYDGTLTVLQAGRGKVSGYRDNWHGLELAVACVPGAAVAAADARSSAKVGTALLWIGALAMVAGAVGGGVLLAENEDPVPGLLALFGGLAAGTAFMATGSYKASGSMASAIDAVNLFNDHYTASPACSGAWAGQPPNGGVGRGLVPRRR